MEIMGRLRDQTFDPTEFPDIESYIWFLQSNVIRTTGMECPLPEGDTEAQARAMFRHLDKIGGLTLLEDWYGRDTVFCLRQQYQFRTDGASLPDAQIVGPVTLENYELRFRGSGFATVTPKKGSVVHGLLWKLTPESERALDRYEGYPRHYTKEQVSVRTTDDAAVSVMAYIMAEPMSRQPALPSPYYYRAIQQGFEANGLPVESLEEAWNRTIDEIWLGKVERLKNGKNLQTRKPER